MKDFVGRAATESYGRTNSRVAHSALPTSACSGWRTSPPLSTRRNPRSSPSAPPDRNQYLSRELTVGTVMKFTLSVDHRAIDGALAAEWLRTFVAVLGDPIQVLL